MLLFLKLCGWSLHKRALSQIMCISQGLLAIWELVPWQRRLLLTLVAVWSCRHRGITSCGFAFPLLLFYVNLYTDNPMNLDDDCGGLKFNSSLSLRFCEQYPSIYQNNTLVFLAMRLEVGQNWGNFCCLQIHPKFRQKDLDRLSFVDCLKTELFNLKLLHVQRWWLFWNLFVWFWPLNFPVDDIINRIHC